MTLWPGDTLEDDDGEEFLLGAMLTYRGCGSPGPFCSQIDGRCVQWHCASCDAPVSSMGHDCPRRVAFDEGER